MVRRVVERAQERLLVDRPDRATVRTKSTSEPQPTDRGRRPRRAGDDLGGPDDRVGHAHGDPGVIDAAGLLDFAVLMPPAAVRFKRRGSAGTLRPPAPAGRRLAAARTPATRSRSRGRCSPGQSPRLPLSGARLSGAGPSGRGSASLRPRREYAKNGAATSGGWPGQPGPAPIRPVGGVGGRLPMATAGWRCWARRDTSTQSSRCRPAPSHGLHG
jgi:hypothetical protein